MHENQEGENQHTEEAINKEVTLLTIKSSHITIESSLSVAASLNYTA